MRRRIRSFHDRTWETRFQIVNDEFFAAEGHLEPIKRGSVEVLHPPLEEEGASFDRDRLDVSSTIDEFRSLASSLAGIRGTAKRSLHGTGEILHPGSLPS